MHNVVSWSLYFAIAVIIIGATAATMLIGAAWVQPRIRQISQGIKPIKGHLPCCPPGLGCNDPDKRWRKCYRTEAKRLATVEELLALDGAWVAYSAVPVRQKRKKAAALNGYHAVRDRIIGRALEEAADKLNGSRPELPAQLEDRNLQSVSGEVA